MNANIVLPGSAKEKIDRVNGYAGRPIAEMVVNGFFTVDKKWTVQYWNKAAERILKISAADILGKNLWEVFADLLPPEFYAVYYKAFENNIPIHFEEYWGEMGAWFDVVTYYCDNTLSVSFKSSNKSGDPAYPTTIEQQLNIKTSLYKFITEVTNDCLWEWDLITKEIFWIDGGHKRVFGYQVENALIPQSFWEDNIHPQDKMRILEKINTTLLHKTATTWENDYRFKKANGEYAWVHDRGHIIYEADDCCRMIGATQDITQRVLLEQQLVSERLAREKEITSMAFTAQEKERATVGKELLDNVSHILSTAKLYMEMARTDALNRESLLDQSGQYIVEVMNSIRRISKALAPPFIQLLGLAKSIKILTDDVSSDSPVRFTTYDSGLSLDGLDEKLQLDIFRIAEHQISNIIQYANATLATIDISKYEQEIVLFISDNGDGCDMNVRKAGAGINSIISRANLYKGSVTTISSPGEGYTLQVIFRFDAS